MQGTGIRQVVAVVVLGFVATAPAIADYTATDVERVKALSRQLNELESRQQALLERQVEDYLLQTSAWDGAMADDGLKGVTIGARLTALFQGTVDLTPANHHIVAGIIEISIDFEVTENLDMFVLLDSNDGGAARFPANFPLVGGIGGGFGLTFNSLSDGIGVDGLVGVTGPGRVLRVHDAGLRWRRTIGNSKLEIEAGALDPRTRFHQNAYADDHHTQFINNLFADSPTVLWLTDSTGRTSLGLHLSITFGDNDAFTVNVGWFNVPGAFFTSGQFFIQLTYRTEVNDGAMNIRVFGFNQEFFIDPRTGDGDSGGGLSWDWRATDTLGIFLRLAMNDDDANPIEFSGSIGVVLFGLIGRRNKDEIGLALGTSEVNGNHFIPAIAGVPQDTESIIELYYKFVFEDGGIEVTIDFQIVLEPGGNGTGWLDDAFYILGIRIHVPF